MFDVGFSELLLLAIVALIVLGPEKLPHAARVAGAWIGRIRRTVSNMQAEIEREVSAQEFKTRLEKELKSVSSSDMMQELKAETQTLEAGFHEVRSSASEHLSPPPRVDAAAFSPDQASTLADAATPLDQVEMDGEKAYREWLLAQKNNRILPPEKPPGDTSVDQASS